MPIPVGEAGNAVRCFRAAVQDTRVIRTTFWFPRSSPSLLVCGPRARTRVKVDRRRMF